MGKKVVSIEPGFRNGLAGPRQSDALNADIKVRLAVDINQLIEDQRLTRATAATRLQVSQSKISALKNYKLDDFSFHRLMSFWLALRQDVVIRITRRRIARAPGRIVVRAAPGVSREWGDACDR